MWFDLYLKQGILVDSAGTTRAGVLVKDGKIAGLVGGDENPQALKVINASGKYILPGLIDVHVHFRTPGLTYKEDFGSGSLAAACGGITTVIDMPNVKPPTTGTGDLAAKIEQIAGTSWVDYGLMAALTRGNINQLEHLAEAGATGFKLFFNEIDPPLAPPGDEELGAAFGIIAGTGLCLAVHAEVGRAIADGIERLKGKGRTDPLAHPDSRPPRIEAEAIRQVITLARGTGAKLHICHLSSREGVEQIRRVREEGIDLSAETAPHYLLLDSTMMEQLGPLLKVNPPLRAAEHKEALWEALAEGVIEILASDHAPHTREEKLKPSIWEVPSGFCGVETLAPLMLNEVNRGRLSIKQLVALLSENPARRYNLYPRKGTIALGADADFTLVDLEADKILRAEGLHSKSQIIPYEGFRIKGVPVATIVGGRVVMEDGMVLGEPEGKMVRPAI